MLSDDRIEIGHGSGGSLSADLISNEFIKSYVDTDLYLGDDATVLNNIVVSNNKQIVISTDSFVVDPLFFPGGDIGKLSICGTVNDVCTSGATPIAMSVSFIIEEGFEITKLKKICSSIADCAKQANVSIVTGDTKVVQSGKCDGIYMNTTGIGLVDKDKKLSGNNIVPGDAILLSGTIGDHGMCIMAKRDSFEFEPEICSDCAPLNTLVEDVLAKCPHTRCFRDPTRGGIASTLNEFAKQSNVDIIINQTQVPVKKTVKSACDLLGLDVFHVANEGKMLCVVPKEQAVAVLKAMRSNEYGKDACIIGYAQKSSSDSPKVFLQTEYNTRRILDMLAGQQLPRIC